MLESLLLILILAVGHAIQRLIRIEALLKDEELVPLLTAFRRWIRTPR